MAKKFEESLNVAKEEEEAIGVTANAVENALNPSEIAVGIERALFERCERYGERVRRAREEFDVQLERSAKSNVTGESVARKRERGDAGEDDTGGVGE